MTEPIKFSFAKPANNAFRKRQQDDEERRDYITGVNGNEIVRYVYLYLIIFINLVLIDVSISLNQIIY